MAQKRRKEKKKIVLHPLEEGFEIIAPQFTQFVNEKVELQESQGMEVDQQSYAKHYEKVFLFGMINKLMEKVTDLELKLQGEGNVKETGETRSKGNSGKAKSGANKQLELGV